MSADEGMATSGPGAGFIDRAAGLRKNPLLRSSRSVLFVVLVLVATACSSESQPTEVSTTADDNGDSQSQTDPAASPDVLVLPTLPLLSSTADVAEPGATIDIVGDSRLSGEVFLVGPAGDLASAPMDGGSASLSIPAGLVPGRYGLRLGDGAAMGIVTVMESPGLALLGAGFVEPGEAAQVDVVVHGLSGGMVAAIETRAGDGTIERLAPHPMLGLAPIPVMASFTGLSEGRHQLALPAGFEGTVRVVAGPSDVVADPYSEIDPSVVSSGLRIRICDAPSGIVGDLGSGGVVRVQTAGSSSIARDRTEDGAFQLDLVAGWSLVSATRDDGSVPAGSPQLVKVGCGEVVDLADLEAPAEVGPEAGEYLGGLTLDDLWVYTTTATGDLSFEQEGFVDCSIDGGALEVTLGADAADPWLYTLTIGPSIETGRVQGALHLDDIFSGGSADGILDGEIEVGRIDDLDAIGGAFSGPIDGTLGATDIQIRFTCAVFSVDASTQSSGAGQPEGLLVAARPSAALAFQIGGGMSSGDECKKLFINSSQPEGVTGLDLMMDYWAGGLMSAVPRVSIVTAADVRVMLELEAQRQLFGVDDSEVGSIDIAGAIGSDFLLHMDVRSAGTSWFFTATLYDAVESRRLAGLEATGASAETAALAALDRWPEMVEPLAAAGICAEFAPTSAIVDAGASQEFTIEVTDLAGEPPESAEVLEFSASCGTWAPSSGAVEGDQWDTEFTADDTACEEKVSVTVEADGTVGVVEADADATVAVEALWQFAVTITLEDAHSTITAESSGEFFVESDLDALIGAGTGFIQGSGEAFCQVNDLVEWLPYTLVANYNVMITGAVTERPDNGPATVEFAPMGFGISSDMTYLTSGQCVEAGTYHNELLGFLGTGVLVGMPHFLANQPGGFVTYLNPSGAGVSFEETLAGLPGATIRGRLWRPEP